MKEALFLRFLHHFLMYYYHQRSFLTSSNNVVKYKLNSRGPERCETPQITFFFKTRVIVSN